jgi:hypothetical protein
MQDGHRSVGRTEIQPQPTSTVHRTLSQVTDHRNISCNATSRPLGSSQLESFHWVWTKMLHKPGVESFRTKDSIGYLLGSPTVYANHDAIQL